MSKTDELKKLAIKITGSAPNTSRASNVVEYIADEISGDTENTNTISQSIRYLTDVYEGGSSGDIEKMKEDIQYLQEDVNYLYGNINNWQLASISIYGEVNQEISLNSTTVGTFRYLLGVYEGEQTTYTETFRNNPVYAISWTSEAYGTSPLQFFINELEVTTDGSDRINTFKGSTTDLNFDIRVVLTRGSNNRYTGKISILEV